jgi:TIR domain
MASPPSPRGAGFARPSSGAQAGGFDAFICCTPSEASEAKLIREALEEGGVRCVISPSDIRPGHQPVMILLLTRNTSESQAIESEVGRAVYRGFPLVVVRLDGIPPSKRLAYYLTSRPFHRLDAVTPPLRQHLPRLLQLVGSSLGIASAVSLTPPRTSDAASASLNKTRPAGTVDDPRPVVAGPRLTRERVGFISYSASDDDASDGALLGLRSRIHSELQIQLGSEVRLWQNRHTIPQGAHWEAELKNAIAESDFFVAIVTPDAMASEICAAEYQCFLERESALRGRDMIFPLLYIDVPGLDASEQALDGPQIRVIEERGCFDWRELRHQPVTSPEVARSAAEFCGMIAAKVMRTRVAA